MTEAYIRKHSFKFGGADMWERFGVQIMENGIGDDVLLPALRPRKVSIPGRSGAYDYGGRYYDERTLTLACVTVRGTQSPVGARAILREISYTLSKKAEIRLWNEPEKYYVGRVYTPPSLIQIRNTGVEFSLSLLCEPFAYGETKTLALDGLRWAPDYPGTAPTPTLITIRNTGTTTIQGIRITQEDRKE